MKEKKITTDQLAIMIQNGFKEMDDKFDEVYKKMDAGFMQVHEELGEVKTDVSVLKIDVSNLKNDFAKMEPKVDRIENILLNDHTARIVRLESKVLG